MGFTVLPEVVAQTATKGETTAADDLLGAFGLSRLYDFATNAPITNPYSKLKTAIDKRLFKSERWSLASAVDRVYHGLPWNLPSSDELRRAFPLQPVMGPPVDLDDRDRGEPAAPFVGDAKTEQTSTMSEGPSEASGRPASRKSGGRGGSGERKSGSKSGSGLGSKRRRMQSMEPGSTEETVVHEPKRQRA
mmetsp:Transcript_38541/g.85813  ORF Transcript_38541/g.85813 Transcript_38541/m.85813 type:complete len:191 (+) Transcript_38541:132-704(+)|eukprot:CAMPEP_0202894078 /NCGR_PEP_ID=MMETSP1392-20130828/3529_1 /ASSEMBLY_ACC=CAM_ASM_000868 /TAXON_ID=225041 /ORGANISM="Chlamydomonas chlamydogama, Strain SAG 11-48b" /LENGTH=190 /DNA_ID=CAMNT_0049578631 /DNA_START=132 /DNA_END=704 /DNA_ORIENTATION=-